MPSNTGAEDARVVDQDVQTPLGAQGSLGLADSLIYTALLGDFEWYKDNFTRIGLYSISSARLPWF